WNLEELTAIEAYANCPNPPRSNREADWRQWAGAVGFTVTITKPYYWQAGTSKEKDFFIASTVKIYRKYTKGQVPELKGFDDPTRSQILGLPTGAAGPPPVPLHAQDRREMKVQTIWRLHNHLLPRESKAETGADIEGLQGRRLACTIRRDKARIPQAVDKKVPHQDPD
ncbi:hypothetical protein KC352_g40562, partial [Hortaea werneckii]